ncbi:PKD domain-containing protein, partial [Aquiflexum lacus]|uniref:PKD domain-containing protein n=1 Tax=Aquiflexum lacus TaxID=2483805 RepID=UPI0018950908
MKKTITYFANLALLLVWNFLAIPNEVYAQNQPNLLDLRTCDNSCSSNNFTIKEVYLSDANGVPLSSSFATCTPGVQQTSFISFVYSSNAGSNTSNTRLFADLSIGNNTEYINIWIGNLPSAKNADRVVTLNHSFTWTCGAEVSLDSPTLAWTTSGSANLFSSYQCNSYPSAQCQFGADIVVNAPLAVQFDFTACTVDGNTTVNFTSTTNGGSQPYQYNWNFGNNANPTTSNLPNPTVTYSSAGSATLTVTDSKGVTNTFTKNITIPTELSVSSTTTQPTPGNNDGSILISTTGGTGNISVSWNDGSTDLERTGLAAGTYIATVTDEFNCQKTITINLTSPEPNISLIKSGVYEDTNGDGSQNVGDKINYTFLVTNTGNFPLSNVTVTDPLINLTGSSFSLPVGESNNIAFSGSYTLTQQDIENGFFTNSATVTADAGSIQVTDNDSHTENFAQLPSLKVEKNQIDGPNPVTVSGQQLTYEITVENTGNINISNVVATDFLPGSSSGVVLNVINGDNQNPGILDVGEIWVYSIVYTVEQNIFDTGDNLVNVVNVSSTQVPGPIVASAVTPTILSPSLEISKAITETTFAAPGDELNYTITVSNTGNTTLENISVVDPLTGLNNTITVLAPGASQDINT